MDLSSAQRLYLILAFTVVGVFSIFLQQSLLLHWDVSWLTHAASLLLDGKTYSKNFFEIAPPSNLLLYTPSVFLMKFFSISIFLAVRIYVFTLGLISLGLCYFFIKKIFAKKDALLALAFFISLEFIFFVMPLNDFGQKEHLFIIFIMPYILLMVCRAQDIQINRYEAALIGLFAGFGIAMKPFFLLFPALLEGYYYITQNRGSLKQIKPAFFIRPENCAILIVLLMYAVITYVFFRDYLTVVVPYALRWNYQGMATPWYLLFPKKILIFLFTILFFIMQYQYNTYKHLTSVILIALIASFLSYVAQRTNFSYHGYPEICFNLLLCVLLLGMYISSSDVTRPRNLLVGFFLVLLALYLYPLFHFSHLLITLYPDYFICFFSLLFFLLLYFTSTPAHNVIIIPIAVASVGILINYLAIRTTEYPVFIMMLFIACVFLFSYKKSNEKFTHYATSALLVFLFFILLYADKVLSYQAQLRSDKNMRKYIEFVDKYAAHKSIYFFSTLIEHVPIVDYSKNTTTAMRFAYLWMIPAMVKEGSDKSTLINDKNFLIKMITDDLHNKKPYLVFVDVSKIKPFLYSFSKDEPVPFDFLSFFLTNNDFKSEWNYYHYLATVSAVDARRKFAVYRRDSYN